MRRLVLVLLLILSGRLPTAEAFDWVTVKSIKTLSDAVNGVTFDGLRLYTLSTAGLTTYDTETLTVIRAVAIGVVTTSTTGIVFDGLALWFHLTSGATSRWYKVDRNMTAITFTGGRSGERDVCFDGKFFYVVNDTGMLLDTVEQYDQAFTLVRTINLSGPGASGIATDGKNLYIGMTSNLGAALIEQIALDGTVIKTGTTDLISPSGFGALTIEALTWDGKYLWALVDDSTNTATQLVQLTRNMP